MNSTSTAGPLNTEGLAMTESDFAMLSGIIRSECGIRLTPVKKVMLTVRLIKRIKALGMSSFAQYAGYLQSPRGRVDELSHMIDAVSTNKTDFFREAVHFDYLARVAVPTLERETELCRRNGINVWSAGCAGGEEAYTIAMVLSEYGNKGPVLCSGSLRPIYPRAPSRRRYGRSTRHTWPRRCRAP